MTVVFSHLNAGLTEEDLTKLKNMKAIQVQTWCLLKIDQYRGRILALRALYDLVVHGTNDREDWPAAIPDSELQGIAFADLPGAAITQIQECKARIRALRSLYNSAAPINHALPVELLMEIFIHLRPRFNRRRGMSILRVCRAWMEIMYSTPQFWANLLAIHQDVTGLSDWKLNRLQFALKLSSTLPLTFSFRGLPVALAQLLHTKYADRISELHVDIAVSVEGLNLLLQNTMPSLKRLSITPKSSHSMSLGRWQSTYATLPDATLVPALRSIRVTAPHFTSSIASASLRDLDLIPCWCRRCQHPLRDAHEDRFNPLLLALAQCASLETLRLNRTRCLPGSDDWYPDSDSERLQLQYSSSLHVNLPQLRHLYVRDPSHAISILLSRLTFPCSASLEIITEFSSEFTLPTPFDIRTLHGIANAEQVGLDFSNRLYCPCSYTRLPRYIMQTCINGRQMLRVMSHHCSRTESSEPYGHYTPYFEDIGKLFGSKAGAVTVTSLAVVGLCQQSPYPVERAVQRWSTLLRTFPLLTRLACSGTYSDDLAVVLEALCHAESSRGTCICPSVRVLHGYWSSEAHWPWVDETLLQSSVGKDTSHVADTGEDEDAVSFSPWMHRRNRISGVHIETDDKKSWLPYGVAETRAFVERIRPWLSRRIDLGAVPVQELHVGIHELRDSYYHDSDQQYLDQHLPPEPLESRLETLLNGLVQRVVVTELESDWSSESDLLRDTMASFS